MSCGGIGYHFFFVLIKYRPIRKKYFHIPTSGPFCIIFGSVSLSFKLISSKCKKSKESSLFVSFLELYSFSRIVKNINPAINAVCFVISTILLELTMSKYVNTEIVNQNAMKWNKLIFIYSY